MVLTLCGGTYYKLHQNDQIAYPDPTITPGAINTDITQDNIQFNICDTGNWSTKSERPPVSYTNPLKLTQMAEYGDTVSDPDATCMPKSDNPKCYEEDHLISLEIGGNPTDPNNLWPEPYSPTPGAKEKDQVENFLHSEICDGKITLAQAQQSIVHDWYAIYQSITSPVSSDDQDDSGN